MFVDFPIHNIADVRDTVLILNTVLLIVALITVELVYSEKPKRERRKLRYFFPLFLVLCGLLIVAVYVQGKGQ